MTDGPKSATIVEQPAPTPAQPASTEEVRRAKSPSTDKPLSGHVTPLESTKSSLGNTGERDADLRNIIDVRNEPNPTNIMDGFREKLLALAYQDVPKGHQPSSANILNANGITPQGPALA